MKLQSLLQQNLHRLPSWRTLAGIAFALIIITPFCGYAFACGCTWPGFGLDEHCNIRLSDITPKCPWCQYQALGLTAGIGAPLAAALAGRFTGKLTPTLGWGLVLLAPIVFLGLWALITRLMV
ncbi:MAG: hypothetical protein CTY29_07530 [Methylobacter sp.]|nr:MAG: hypothetical protein CTY29_07530 [Methylobacter sp.]